MGLNSSVKLLPEYLQGFHFNQKKSLEILSKKNFFPFFINVYSGLEGGCNKTNIENYLIKKTFSLFLLSKSFAFIFLCIIDHEYSIIRS